MEVLIYVPGLDSAAVVYTLLSLLPCLLLAFLAQRYSHAFDPHGGERRPLVWSLSRLGLWALGWFVLLSLALITLGVAAAVSEESRYVGQMVAGGAAGLWIADYYSLVYLDHHIKSTSSTSETAFIEAVFGPDRTKADEINNICTWLHNVALVPLALSAALPTKSSRVPSINPYGLLGALVLLAPHIWLTSWGTAAFVGMCVRSACSSLAALGGGPRGDEYDGDGHGRGDRIGGGRGGAGTINPLFSASASATTVSTP